MVMVMDSKGLHVNVFVVGGQLDRSKAAASSKGGPQVIKREGVYFLCFASGRYCEEDYYNPRGSAGRSLSSGLTKRRPRPCSRVRL
jgi:hypothetical protein